MCCRPSSESQLVGFVRSVTQHDLRWPYEVEAPGTALGGTAAKPESWHGRMSNLDVRPWPQGPHNVKARYNLDPPRNSMHKQVAHVGNANDVQCYLFMAPHSCLKPPSAALGHLRLCIYTQNTCI